MKKLPNTRPPATLVARRRDYWRLNRLAFDGMCIVFARHAGYRRLVITLILAYVAQVTFVTVLNPVVGLLMYALFIALPFVALLALMARTGWRLADPNRIVILSLDRRSVIDVVAQRGGTLTIAHHAKLVGSVSAAPLRQNVAAWLRDEPHHDLQFRAQGRRVADVYMRQFPELVESPIPNLLGTIELSLPPGRRTGGAAVKDRTPAS